MLELETPVLPKQYFSEPRAAQRTDLPAESALDTAFDLEVCFERWLADIKGTSQRLADNHLDEEIYLESARSKTEVSFEGVLHFDGYTSGNINSPEGTLVLAKAGRVEADIDVGKAVIRGSVTGNINAPEGVILDSDARVSGRIRTRMLSVRVGALFEGDCLFTADADKQGLEKSSGVEWLDKEEPLASAAAAASRQSVR